MSDLRNNTVDRVLFDHRVERTDIQLSFGKG